MVFCDSLHSGAVSLECGLGKLREEEVEIGLEIVKSGRAERKASLREVMFVYSKDDFKRRSKGF